MIRKLTITSKKVFCLLEEYFSLDEINLLRKRLPELYDDTNNPDHIIIIIRRGKFDIVHSHSTKAGMLDRSAAWLSGAKENYYTPHMDSIFRLILNFVSYVNLGF